MVRPGWDQGPQPGGNHSSILKILLDFHVQTSQVYLKIIFANLFLLIFWLHWVFVAARALSLVAASGCYSAVVVRELLMGGRPSLVAERGLSSRQTQESFTGWLARGLWDCPAAGIELMSPALAAGFLTTESCSVMSSCLWPHGLLQARILEWAAFPSSRESSRPWDGTQVSCIAGRDTGEPVTSESTWSPISFSAPPPPFLYENLKVSRDESFFFFFFFRGGILLIEGGHAVLCLYWSDLL